VTTALVVADAVLLRLTSAGFPFPVFDGVAGPDPSYAVFYGGAGVPRSDRQSDLGSRLDWGCYIVCAGRNRQQALNVADKVRTRLTGHKPDSSTTAEPLTEVSIGADLIRDDSDPADVRFSITLRFTLSTHRS
jgi:hypothetical protein